MKKIFAIVLFLMLLFGADIAGANGFESGVMPVIKFKGNVYTLYYSAKSKELGGYINEYYKARENYTNWSELTAIHHYPKAFYPIEHAKDFQTYIESSGVQANLEADEDSNSAVLDFIIINSKRLPIILEYNIFRYEKSPVCGTQALQYAKRYRLNNALEIDKTVKQINKSRKNLIKAVKKLDTPELIARDADKGCYTGQEKVIKEFKMPKKAPLLKIEDDETVEIKKSQSEDTEFEQPKPFEEFFKDGNEPDFEKYIINDEDEISG